MKRRFSLYFTRPQPEGSARHFLHLDFPYFHVAHGGFAVFEFVIDVLLHDDVEYVPFFIHVFDETDIAPTHYAARLHAIAACHLPVHVHQFVSFAKGDADARTAFDHLHFAAFGAGVQIDYSIAVGEVHGNHVGVAFQVGDAHHAVRAFADDCFNFRRFDDCDCFHKAEWVFYPAQR